MKASVGQAPLVDRTQLVRLDPAQAQAWAQWPQMEARIRRFCATYSGDTPVEAVIAHLRQLFVSAPQTLGVWALCRSDTDIIGHLVSWVDLFWGQPFIHVWQAEIDPHHAEGWAKTEMMRQLTAWVTHLNAAYAAAGTDVRITMIRWLTERPDAWLRYFQRTPQRRWTLLTLSVGAEEDETHGRVIEQPANGTNGTIR